MLNQQISQLIAQELNVRDSQILAAIQLLDDGNTIPFIARYRKEATGGLDDTQLRHFETRLIYLRELEDRRQTILKSIEEQGKLTDELHDKAKPSWKICICRLNQNVVPKAKLPLKQVLNHWRIYFGTSQKQRRKPPRLIM